MPKPTRVKVIRHLEHRKGKKVGTDFSRFQFSLQDFPMDKVPTPDSPEWARIKWSTGSPVGGRKMKTLIKQGKLLPNAFPNFKYQNNRVLYDRSFTRTEGLRIKRDWKNFDYKNDDAITFNLKFYVRSDDTAFLSQKKYRDDRYSEQRLPYMKEVDLIPVLHRTYYITTTASNIKSRILKHQLPLKLGNAKVYDDLWAVLNNPNTIIKSSGKFELDKGTIDSIRNSLIAVVSDFRQNPMATTDPLSYYLGVAHDDYLMNVRGWKLSSDLSKRGLCKFYSDQDQCSTFPKGGCLYTLLYYVFRDAIRKRNDIIQAKKKTTFSFGKEGKYDNFCISKIYKIIHNTDDIPDPNEYDKWGLSFEQVSRFLEYYNAEGAVWDGFEGKFRNGFNLGKGCPKMPKFHYVYANQHAFLISENTTQLSVEVSSILERISAKLDIDVSVNYENEWTRFRLPMSSIDNEEYLFTDNLEEMVSFLGQDIENITHIMTNLDLADVFLDLWKQFGIKPCVDSRGQSISRLRVLQNKKWFWIENQFSASAGQTFISNIEEYMLYRQYFNKIKMTLLHPRYLSVYSPQVRQIVQTFKKGGLKCCFDWGLCDEPMIYEGEEYMFDEDNQCSIGASDVNRFYLSEFLKLEFLPVFNVDCYFVQYDGSALEDYTVYMVEKLGDFFEYPYYGNDLCFGLQLRKLKHSRFVIQKMMRPAHLEVNIMKEMFEEIYQSSLSDGFKKDIGNILLGFLLQKNKNIYKTYHTTDLKEAEGFRRSIGGYFFDFRHRGETHGYIYSKCFSSKLVDGFYFLGLLYLDGSHFYIHSLINRMKECGLEPFAINVDCVYHNKLQNSVEYNVFRKKYFDVYFNYQDKNHLSAIGKLKYEEVQSQVWSEFKIKTFDFTCSIPSFSIQHLKHESVEEMTAFLKDKKRMFVLGQGGMGKSFTLLKALEALVGKKRILVLSKSWKLTDNWIVQEYASQTIDGFFHYQPGRFVCSEFLKMDDLSTFDAIVIDDMFLNSIYIWHSVFLLMEQFPDKIIVGNGDPYQIDAVFDVFFNAFDGHREKKMMEMAGRLFGSVIELQQNKRLTLESDRLAYQQLITIIKSDVSKDVQYLQMCDWMRQHCKVIDDVRKVPSHLKVVITANNRQRSFWNEKIFPRVYPRQDWFSIGHIIMYDRGTVERKGMRMGRFQEFVLKECSEDRVVLQNHRTKKVVEIEDDTPKKNDKDDKLIGWVRSRFTYPFGFTCHSWQGSTINEKLLIDGFFDTWITNKWRFTALTRNCRFLDIFVLEKSSQQFLENTRYYSLIIQRHLESDRKRFAVIDMERYIDVEWYANQLHTIRVNARVCPGCGGHPDSCDRIQSHLPHYKSNCRFICKDCNRSKRNFN